MAYRFVCAQGAAERNSWIEGMRAHRRYLTRMIACVVAEEVWQCRNCVYVLFSLLCICSP